MERLTDTRPLPPYASRGAEHPLSAPVAEELGLRPRRRSRAAMLIVGSLVAMTSLVGAVMMVTVVQGLTAPEPPTLEPAVSVPAEERPSEASPYEQGAKLGERYNETKKNASEFLEGFTDETSVDETWRGYRERAAEGLEKLGKSVKTSPR